MIPNSLIGMNSIMFFIEPGFQGLEASNTNRCSTKKLERVRPDAHQHPQCDYLRADHCSFQIAPEIKDTITKAVLFLQMNQFCYM